MDIALNIWLVVQFLRTYMIYCILLILDMIKKTNVKSLI